MTLKALFTNTHYTYRSYIHVMVIYCGQYPQEQIQVKCPRTQRLYRRSGGGFHPLDLIIIAQRTAPHRPSSHLQVIEALLQVHIDIIHVLWTIPTH